jgi:carboxyl-terminal processing protease
MKKVVSRLAFVGLTLVINACSFAQQAKLAENYENVIHNIAKMVEVVHYKQPVYDNAFSSRLFNAYFEELDPSRLFFTQADKKLMGRFEYHLDEELRQAPPEFFLAMDTLYRSRVIEAKEMAQQILSSPLVLNGNDSFMPDRDSAQFPASVEEKRSVWRKYLTYQVLDRYDDMFEAADQDKQEKVIDTSMERKSREFIALIQNRYFDRLLGQAAEPENFSKYVNSIMHLLDPHSEYFLPVEKRSFQEDLTGIYYGIGAVLQDAGGKISISELMIGGPAWKSGQVEKGDVIVAVAQEGDTAHNVEGLAMPEVIKQTRGKKESVVTITFRKADGKLKRVTLKRDALQLEDTFVRSAVIGDSVKIGYIYLPKFYTSFDDKNGRSCAADIAKEIVKLKKEQVKGIVIDVRDNGGGSLGEVIRMVGLFIKEGPVVQVKSRDKEPEVAKVEGKEVVYSGPLVILVNELSASASEIFAAAIQDYHRGVIVGSPSTFGKGTVQRGFRVPGSSWSDMENDLGSVHLTLQKYYRINGGATQLKGISPDVVLPGLYESYKLNEKYYASALPWDEIRSAGYTPVSDTGFVSVVRNKSVERQNHTLAFSNLRHNLDTLSWRTSVATSLNFEKFREQRNEVRKAMSAIRKNSQQTVMLKVANTAEDIQALNQREQFRRDNNNAWLKHLEKDLYLSEAICVMRDLIRMSNS